MLRNKMIRLATKCDQFTTRFLRRIVSVPTGEKETKHADPDEVNEFAQFFGVSTEEWIRHRKIFEWNLKFSSASRLCPFGDGIYHPRAMELVDEFEDICNDPPPRLRRKPIDLGDSFDQEASGRRVFNATEALLAKHGKAVRGLTFAIQGFGNVGSWIARLVHEGGGKVVAVSDMTRAVKNKEGIDVPALLKHKGNDLADFSGGDSMDAIELLYSECDVLIPGALAQALRRKFVEDVKAKFVVDTADCPVSSYLYQILSKNGIVNLSDTYLKYRAPTDGYLDWMKAQGFTWGKV